MLAPRSALLIVEGGILATLTILSVVVQVRRLVENNVAVDTSRWLLLGGAILAQVMTGLITAMAALGLGKKMSAEEFDQHEVLKPLLFASFLAYLLCNMVIKLSWLTFFYGLTCKRRQTYLLHGMQGIALGFGISSIMVVLTYYGMHTANRHFEGINIQDFWFFNSAFMIVTDTMMYVIPIWLLYHNTTIRGHQSGVYMLFALGGIVVVASILRFSAVYDLAHTGNPSGAYAMIWFWSALENHLGICVACAGALKQQVVTVFGNLRRRSCRVLPESACLLFDRLCCACWRRKPPRLIVYKSQTTCVTSAPMSGKNLFSSTNASSMSESGIQCWFEVGEEHGVLVGKLDRSARAADDLQQ